MNPELQDNLINVFQHTDGRTFKPIIMDLIKEFNKTHELPIDINVMKNDDYEKRGLILQTQKVKRNIFIIIAS
jgi:hypothetical protein